MGGAHDDFFKLGDVEQAGAAVLPLGSLGQALSPSPVCLDITLVDRHLTVILSGKTIIDNQAAPGCNGGAMTRDEFKPGPIFLQGDNTNVDYRNMVLRPVLK